MARIRSVFALIRAFLFRSPVELDAAGVPLIFDPASGRLMPRIAGAEGDGDGGEGEGDDEGSEGDEGDGEGDGEGSGEGKSEPDWKAESRKHERRSKAERKKREEAEAELKKLRDADKSEQEKALEKAREEAKAEALTEAQQERRRDRLEVAATRLASRGFEVEVTVDGETKTETVKFADSDDALVYLERAIASGDVDSDDIFDSDGKVQTDAVESALGEILERKPHLKAGAEAAGNGNRPKGKGDGGKGTGAAKSVEDLSIEELDEKVRTRK